MTCDLLKAREKLRVQGVISFGFVSYVLSQSLRVAVAIV